VTEDRSVPGAARRPVGYRGEVHARDEHDGPDDRRTSDDTSIEDELIGLDPDDPETRAFAEHLRRMRNDRPGYTVEGYLRGVGDFANSANRAVGHRRLTALILVGLLLLGAVWAVWQTLGFVIGTFLH
jgi:hypothetical protein